MSVDDIAAQGAEPLFFLDYISIGKLVPEEIDEIVAGVADGCRAGRLRAARRRDVGAPRRHGAGRVRPRRLRGRRRRARRRAARATCAPATAIVGFASPGLRCNGYSLARRALLDRAGRRLDDPAWPGAHHSLGDELLRPSVIYAPAMRKLRERVDVHAFAHVTGGGLPGNLARVLPDRTATRVVAARRLGRAADLRARSRRPATSPTTRWSTCSTSGLGMLAVVARRGPSRCPRRGARGGPRSLDRRRGVRRPRSGKYHP